MKTIEEIVDNNYCIGCGACASILNSRFEIKMNEYGLFVPVILQDKNANENIESLVCPFANDIDNEDTIGINLFSNTCRQNEYIGFYLKTYAGYVREKTYRESGSSGGLTTWVAVELLKRDLIDGVIHVKPSKIKGPYLFDYGLSTTEHEIRESSKSRYCCVEYSRVMSLIKKKPGRYVFIGVPCVVKSVRLLSKQVPEIGESIKYCFALFCGHQKTRAFAESLAWQVGISPPHLMDFDFRVKIGNLPSSRYAIKATSWSGEERIEEMENLFGADWGLGLFKPSACEFCDDIAGETADISFGDAWLRKYKKDSKGTNLVIVRRPELDSILKSAANEGRITIETIEVKDVYESQSPHFQHKKKGLSYRLWIRKQKDGWHPKKRVDPVENGISKKRKAIYRMRTSLSEQSHTAFVQAKRANDFSVFLKIMNPKVRMYHRFYKFNYRYVAKYIVRRLRQVVRAGVVKPPIN